jgi:hypothetical protein
MKYIAQNNTINYKIQLHGEEEEQNCFATLVENFYGIVPIETYAGQIIEFPNKTKFIKFLMWREIFNQCAPNKQFKFMQFARQAVKSVRQVLNNDVIEVSY